MRLRRRRQVGRRAQARSFRAAKVARARVDTSGAEANADRPNRKARVAHSRLRTAQVNLTAASPRRLDSLDGYALNIKHLHVLHVLHGSTLSVYSVYSVVQISEPFAKT